jgi:hypothetical protein
MSDIDAFCADIEFDGEPMPVFRPASPDVVCHFIQLFLVVYNFRNLIDEILFLAPKKMLSNFHALFMIYLFINS